MKRKIIGISIAATFAFLGVIGYLILHTTDNELEQEQETIITGHGIWGRFNFETAIENAVTIVYGTVTGKSDTLVHEASTSDGGIYNEYYKEVYVDVKQLIKGSVNGTTFTYLEQGGETDDVIYTLEGVNPVSIGEEYVFFVNQYGAMLSPITVLPVSEGIVSTEGKIAPISENNRAATTEIRVEDYISAIKEQLE